MSLYYYGSSFTAVWGFVYYVLGRKYTENYTPGKGMLVAFIRKFFQVLHRRYGWTVCSGLYYESKESKWGWCKLAVGWFYYLSDHNDGLCIDSVLRFAYYSAQSAWFNIILLGYIVNAVVVVALYTIALFPNLYIKLSRILVQLLTKLHILKNPENVGFLDFTSD